MALTDTAIRAAKPKELLVKLSDGRGLQLWVMPTGSKLWRIAYRFQAKQKLLAIGSYPDIGLAAARGARDDAKALLARGIDPMDQRKTDKAVDDALTENMFGTVAHDLMTKKRKEGRSSSTLKKLEWLLAKAKAAFGTRQIADIKTRDILAVLRIEEEAGNLETAIRLRETIGQVFRLAVATDRAEVDPTFALRGAIATPKVKHRAAITDPKAFGHLLREIDRFDGQPVTKAALQLIAMLVPRPGELRMAEWREFDAEKALWTIPASRAKMRREHKIPLPAQALAYLQ